LEPEKHDGAEDLQTSSPRQPPTPREILAATVSEALAQTKTRLLERWKTLPLWFHLIVIALVASGAAAWRYQSTVISNWHVTRFLPVVALSDQTRFALTTEDAKTVRSAIALLQRDALSDLAMCARYPPIAGYEAWPAAQTIVASKFARSDIFDTIARQKEPVCHCWPQFRDMAPNIATTAWILRAYAVARRYPGDAEVRFLINRQREGAWPLYDGTRDQSTYATALAILALYDLVHSGVLPPRVRGDADVALNEGVTFLRTSNSGARWRYYPNRSDSNLSDSDTGLAIYTLHYVGAGDPTLDRLWLDSLPHDELSSRDDEISNAHWLFRPDELQPPLPDAVRHIRLPWIIAGTVSAYSSGTLLQRAKAAALLHQILHATTGTSFLPPEDFKRAELLLALDYLNQQARR
jgi:hypothetical protein